MENVCLYSRGSVCAEGAVHGSALGVRPGTTPRHTQDPAVGCRSLPSAPVLIHVNREGVRDIQDPVSSAPRPGKVWFLPAPCGGEGGPAGSVHLALVLRALAPGLMAHYYPGMCPCFDPSFLVSCGLAVQPSSVAPLTGRLENRTPFVVVRVPGERGKLQVPTGLPWVGKTSCLTLSSS